MAGMITGVTGLEGVGMGIGMRKHLIDDGSPPAHYIGPTLPLTEVHIPRLVAQDALAERSRLATAGGRSLGLGGR